MQTLVIITFFDCGVSFEVSCFTSQYLLAKRKIVLYVHHLSKYTSVMPSTKETLTAKIRNKRLNIITLFYCGVLNEIIHLISWVSVQFLHNFWLVILIFLFLQLEK